MPVVLDPSAAAVIEAFRAANRPKYETMSAPEAREASSQGRAVVQPDPPRIFRRRRRTGLCPCASTSR
jgi:acetyl esterase